jgi:hypothetical protein
LCSKTNDTGANLVRPIGIGIDREHNVLDVSDSVANRVSKIRLLSVPLRRDRERAAAL